MSLVGEVRHQPARYFFGRADRKHELIVFSVLVQIVRACLVLGAMYKSAFLGVCYVSWLPYQIYPAVT